MMMMMTNWQSECFSDITTVSYSSSV